MGSTPFVSFGRLKRKQSLIQLKLLTETGRDIALESEPRRSILLEKQVSGIQSDWQMRRDGRI